MDVLILGVGDAFTTQHFGSSALVRTSAGRLVLIDCPDLALRAMREAAEIAGWNVEARQIDDILLTHLHGDHSNGLEAFGFLRRIGRSQDPSATLPRLHASQPVLDRVWEKLGPAMDGPFMDAPRSTLGDFFDARPLATDRPNTIGDLTVECRFTQHPIPTTGFKLTADGRSLGWSSDTPFEQAHIDWLASADVIVHETNIGSPHTPMASLNGLPDEIRSRMRLMHMPDDFDPACTDIRPLAAGEVIRV